MLLDGIMTNCLFAAGIHAVTARLETRFIHSVKVGGAVRVVARLTKSRGKLHYVKSELLHDGVVMARATASFIELPV